MGSFRPSMHVSYHPTLSVVWGKSCLSAPSALHLFRPVGALFSPRHSASDSPVPVLHVSHYYRQSLHSATWPRRKSLQGQRRLYFGENPAQLKRRGSRWRPHSRRSTEKAGRMWLISESTTSHCTSNLPGETDKQSCVCNLKLQFLGLITRKNALQRLRRNS